jgi:hypothetical protein
MDWWPHKGFFQVFLGRVGTSSIELEVHRAAGKKLMASSPRRMLTGTGAKMTRNQGEED